MAVYPVVVTPEEIGGVYTEVFTPQDGIAPKNKNRVLINLFAVVASAGGRDAEWSALADHAVLDNKPAQYIAFALPKCVEKIER